MKLDNILRQQAKFTEDSGFSVTVTRNMSWVQIDHNNDKDEDILLSSIGADEFIEQLDSYIEQCPDVEIGVIELAVAYQYIS